MTKASMGSQPLVFPTPAWVIGTYDKDHRPNIATAAWGGVCCSKPPCVSVSFREATYTHGNIKARQAFCVCIGSTDHVAETDYAGIVSGRDTDKFAAAGLTPVKSDLVDAPYIHEFPMVVECRLKTTVELGLHTQFVGEILDVKVDKSLVGPNGLPELEEVSPLVFAPRTRRYYAVGERLSDGFKVGKKIQEGKTES